MEEKTPGNYEVARPIEIKCTECGVVSTPAFQMEKNEQDNFVYSDGCLTLCDACMSKGWTDDPEEVSKAIMADPFLSKHIEHLSPYKPEDFE